ncbi:hypothetical protein AAMO2058_000287500 [Amorphochlora amoebiformis]
MISIGATALTFLDKARSMSGLATNIKSWVRDMLPTQDKEVRALLEKLCYRVDALGRPMRYCWLWASDKESSVSDSVYYCRRVLLRVEDYMRDLVNLDTKKRPKTTETVVSELRDHLKELEFCVQSLSLALQITTSIQNHPSNFNGYTSQPQPRSHYMPSSSLGSTWRISGGISPSCLLQASQRLVEMKDTGGDVVTATGRLFIRPNDKRIEGQKGWRIGIPEAVWSIHHDRKTRRYSIFIQDLAPAAGKQERPHKWGQAEKVRANFELERSLGIRSLSVDIFSEIVHFLTPSRDSKVGTNESLKGGSKSSPRYNGSHPTGFLWEEKVANATRNEYAFVIASISPPATKNSPLSPATLPSPSSRRSGANLGVTTMVYISRLCIYENWARSIATKSEYTDKGLSFSEPYHRHATDEELTLILLDQPPPPSPPPSSFPPPSSSPPPIHPTPPFHPTPPSAQKKPESKSLLSASGLSPVLQGSPRVSPALTGSPRLSPALAAIPPPNLEGPPVVGLSDLTLPEPMIPVEQEGERRSGREKGGETGTQVWGG